MSNSISFILKLKRVILINNKQSEKSPIPTHNIKKFLVRLQILELGN